MSKRRQVQAGREYIHTKAPPMTEEQRRDLRELESCERYSSLTPLFQELLARYEEKSPPHRRPVETRAATDFKTLREATRFLGIDYDDGTQSTEHLLSLKDENSEVRTLSPHYDAVIADLRRNSYIPDRTNESFSRVILNLILVDRLNALQDETAHNRLLLGDKVSLAIRVMHDGNPVLVQGRADWAVGYGKSKSTTGNLLIIAEAKHFENELVGLPQLAIYMAAAQDARGNRLNKTIWGILSDANRFHFLCLTEDRKLLFSREKMWQWDTSQILNYIDTILRDAIQSSPHTTPQKAYNSTLRSYARYLAGSWHIGMKTEEQQDEEAEDYDSEPELVNVVYRDGRIALEEQKILTGFYQPE